MLDCGLENSSKYSTGRCAQGGFDGVRRPSEARIRPQRLQHEQPRTALGSPRVAAVVVTGPLFHPTE